MSQHTQFTIDSLKYNAQWESLCNDGMTKMLCSGCTTCDHKFMVISRADRDGDCPTSKCV